MRKTKKMTKAILQYFLGRDQYCSDVWVHSCYSLEDIQNAIHEYTPKTSIKNVVCHENELLCIFHDDRKLRFRKGVQKYGN